MRIRTLICALTISTLAGCGTPQKPSPPAEIRYLPAPAERCILAKYPASPLPPKCYPLDPRIDSSIATNRCSEMQAREYDAQRLDHRLALLDWAKRWFYLCGPKEAQ